MKRFLIGLSVLLFPVLTLAAGDDVSDIVHDNNAFAVDLYNRLSKDTGNLFFSPKSISTALAMTYAGANGDTAMEMANVLHFTQPSEKLHSAMGFLLRDMNTPHKDYVLKVSNALWVQQNYHLLEDFHKIMHKNYGGAANNVDFENDTEQARQNINTAVEEQTGHKIKNFLAKDMIDNTYRIVLTDAVYFKSKWKEPFDANDTEPAPFYLSTGKMVTVPMMEKIADFQYFDGGSFKVLELPYKNDELSMIILLPEKADGLAKIEKSLTEAHIEQWMKKMHLENVAVSLPRFKFSAEYLLDNTLKSMGMERAFDKSRADFTNMVSPETKDGNLYIGHVVHKTFIDVNEKGTEAVAATGVAMRQLMLVEVSKYFYANHPFLFIIWEKHSKSILFMGRVANPAK